MRAAGHEDVKHGDAGGSQQQYDERGERQQGVDEASRGGEEGARGAGHHGGGERQQAAQCEQQQEHGGEVEGVGEELLRAEDGGGASQVRRLVRVHARGTERVEVPVQGVEMVMVTVKVVVGERE